MGKTFQDNIAHFFSTILFFLYSFITLLFLKDRRRRVTVHLVAPQRAGAAGRYAGRADWRTTVCQQQRVPVAAAADPRYRVLPGEEVSTDAVSTVTVAAVATVTVASVTVHIYDITVREQATAARNQHAPRRLPNGDPILPDQLPVVRTRCKGLPALL